MYYTPTMQSAIFETEKNRKAFIYTAIICAVILLLAFFITWPVLKVAPLPITQDLIEIDLGAAEGPIMETMGGGGSPSSSSTATPVNNQQEEDAAQQDASDDNDADAAPVIKNPRPSTSKTPATKPITQPAPVVKKPTITMPTNNSSKPGTSDKDDFGKGPGKGPGEGPGVGPGKGGGAGGTSVVKGVKPLNLGSLRFEDDFNENAKVYIDVRYNSDGSFASASVVKPTTTTNGTILRIAKQKVSALKFPATADGGITTILLNFKIQN